MALPPAADRGGHARRRDLAVGRDRRHARRPAAGAPVRRTDAGDHELARLADHARGRRRPATRTRGSRSASRRPRRSRPSSRCCSSSRCGSRSCAGRSARSSAQALMAELRSLPQKIISTLERQDAVVEIAERHCDKPFFFYLGRHVGLPVCLEGALKLKEISYIPTEAYAAGEMKHGPIALLDDQTPVVCVATDSHVADKLASNLQEVRARAAQVIAVATEGADAIVERRRRRPLGPAHEPAAAAGAGGDPAPAARVPHRPAARPRRRPAAQPRQDGDRRMTTGGSDSSFAPPRGRHSRLDAAGERRDATSASCPVVGLHLEGPRSPSGRTPATTPGVTRPRTCACRATARCGWRSPRAARGNRWSSPASAGSATAAIAGSSNTDLSNPSNVFALFVRDMAVSSASRGEQDIEFARWSPYDVNPGWFVSWTKKAQDLRQLPRRRTGRPTSWRSHGDAATSASTCAMPTGRSCSIRP